MRSRCLAESRLASERFAMNSTSLPNDQARLAAVPGHRTSVGTCAIEMRPGRRWRRAHITPFRATGATPDRILNCSGPGSVYHSQVHDQEQDFCQDRRGLEIHGDLARIHGRAGPPSRATPGRCGQFRWSTAGFKITAGPFGLVELRGLEPLTPCLQSRCSSS
jgi:hypothetical protein